MIDFLIAATYFAQAAGIVGMVWALFALAGTDQW